jgi:hypothetical protein
MAEGTSLFARRYAMQRDVSSWEGIAVETMVR